MVSECGPVSVNAPNLNMPSLCLLGRQEVQPCPWSFSNTTKTQGWLQVSVTVGTHLSRVYHVPGTVQALYVAEDGYCSCFRAEEMEPQ